MTQDKHLSHSSSCGIWRNYKAFELCPIQICVLFPNITVAMFLQDVSNMYVRTLMWEELSVMVSCRTWRPTVDAVRYVPCVLLIRYAYHKVGVKVIRSCFRAIRFCVIALLCHKECHLWGITII